MRVERSLQFDLMGGQDWLKATLLNISAMCSRELVGQCPLLREIGRGGTAAALGDNRLVKSFHRAIATPNA